MKLRKSTNQRGFPFFLGVPFPRLRWHARFCRSKRWISIAFSLKMPFQVVQVKKGGWLGWLEFFRSGRFRKSWGCCEKRAVFFRKSDPGRKAFFFTHDLYINPFFNLWCNSSARLEVQDAVLMPLKSGSLSLSLFDHFFEEANCEEGHGYPSLFTCSKFYLCIVHSFFPSFRSFFRFFPLIVSFFDSMYQYFSMYLAIFLSIFLSINLSIYFMDVSSVYLCIFLCT